MSKSSELDIYSVRFRFLAGGTKPENSALHTVRRFLDRVMVFALIHYFVSARKVYDGPVEYVRKL